MGLLFQMLSNKQIKRLKHLDRNILRCQKCDGLRKNGISIPYWHKYSKYCLFVEAPGFEEIGKHPLVGKAGRKCFKLMKRYKFVRTDFFIINSVQCRPVVPFTNRNGKPSRAEQENCRFWIEKYLKTFKPQAMLACGNYATQYLFNENAGIQDKSGLLREYNGIPTVLSVHPASLLYEPQNKRRFFTALKKLKEVVK